MSDTFANSFVIPSGAHKIERKIDIDAPISSAWRLWTTSDGVTNFMGRTANIDLRIAGSYEIEFLADAPKGSRGSESCKVLAFVPERMLAFTWNAPPNFGALRFQHTWVVLEFEKLSASSTRLHFVHAGFGTGDKWADVHGYFDKAWDRVLEGFAKSVK